LIPPDRENEGKVLFPGAALPDDLRFTKVGRDTRQHFFTPMDLLRPVVNRPLALLQANIRHRSQIAPYLEAFLDSAATGLILALSEGVQQNFGVCIEEATYFAARFIEEANQSGARQRGVAKRVAFLFDHAITYKAAERALQAGVSGIMYDPSEGGRRAIPIKENILHSQRFVRLAEKYEASTELEVGVIPGMEGLGRRSSPTPRPSPPSFKPILTWR
jgi:fructose/tagatose bisphosphate aldolase